MPGYSRALAVLAALSLVCMALSVSVGSASLSVGDTFAVLTGTGTPIQQTLVLELRLPRTLAGFATGEIGRAHV